MDVDPLIADLSRQLSAEKRQNEKLRATSEAEHKTKKKLKRQIERLTWIARAAVGVDALEAILEEPVDFGYGSYRKYKSFPTPRPHANSVPPSSSERTEYAEDEPPEEDEPLRAVIPAWQRSPHPLWAVVEKHPEILRNRMHPNGTLEDPAFAIIEQEKTPLVEDLGVSAVLLAPPVNDTSK
jgi:hypothetical protein